MTYVIIQGNYIVVLWNILKKAEMRRVGMIIPTENTFIYHVKNYGDDV